MATAVKVQPLTQRAAWKALESHSQEINKTDLKALFAGDPGRADRFSLEAAGLFLDYSKNRITPDTMKLLLQLAEESGLKQRTEAMFTGEKINTTENRAVFHVAFGAVDHDERIRAVRVRLARRDGDGRSHLYLARVRAFCIGARAAADRVPRHDLV